jgi:uncharacterized OB-fold protein
MPGGTVTSRRGDLPVIDDSTREFWEAAGRGVLVIKRCHTCSKPHFYPRPFCPFCWSQDLSWEEASGRAVLYTYSVVRQNDLAPFADRVPYVPAMVDLEEGPRMTTELIGVPIEDVRIGAALSVEFVERAPGIAAPVFRPS